MKKSNLIKVFSILVISLMLILFTTTVNAADDGYNNMQGLLTESNTSNGSNTSNTSNSSNNTSNRSNTSNNTSNRVNNTAKNVANNTNTYSNTNLPKTGIESSIPVAMLIVIFAISSVYAYKKINDYKNI